MSDIVASVIVPARDSARWIEECLESLLVAADTLAAPCEILVADDGSEDDTAYLAELVAERDSRLNVLRLPRKGVSAARNAALDVARGEYLFFADSDDTVAPRWLAAGVEAMSAARADYCLMGFEERFTDGRGPRIWRPREKYDFKTNTEIVERYVGRVFGYSFDQVRAWYAGEYFFARRELGGVWRGVFRRELVERGHVRFDETIGLYEDAMFNVEYLLGAERMVSIMEPLYFYNLRPTGAMSVKDRDGRYVLENKWRLLLKRAELDEKSGGRLAAAYAGSCVLSLLAHVRAPGVPWRERFAAARRYAAHPAVRAALADFPISWRKPLVAAGAIAARVLFANASAVKVKKEKEPPQWQHSQ